MGIRGRRDRLERRLEAERPQPPGELVSTLANRLESEPVRRRVVWRTAFALSFTMLLIVAFAMTGGISYAASAVQGGTTAVTSLVKTKAKSKAVTTKAKSKKAFATQRQSTVSGAALRSSSSEDDESGSGGDNDDESNGDEEEEDDDSSADDQYEEEVLICHQRRDGERRTIEVDADEVQRHLDHGDTLGPCPPEDDDEEDDD